MRVKLNKLSATWKALLAHPEGFCCGDAAYESRKALGRGVIFGYASEENPTAILGHDEGGHDFLVVDEQYILDFWGATYYDYNMQYDLETETKEILWLYGPRKNWKTTPIIGSVLHPVQSARQLACHRAGS